MTRILSPENTGISSFDENLRIANNMTMLK